MNQSIAYISDTEDSISTITLDSTEYDVNNCEQNEDHQYVDTLDVPRTNDGNLTLPVLNNVLGSAPIPQITSVTLQNSTDITFGNKLLYNGPITVNQYGVEKKILESKTFQTVNRGKILVAIFVIAVVLVIIATVLAIQLKSKKAEGETGETDGSYNIDDDNTPLRYVTREEWKASPPNEPLVDLVLPVPLVIMHHTVQSSCNTLESCSVLVRQAQLSHLNPGGYFGVDIGYNFLIGGDGAAYIGRGWDKRGGHTLGYNSLSMGVAFIGDYGKEIPTDLQIIALLKLIRDGVNSSKISEKYTLIGANQVHDTESPGKYLFEILTKLPHWSNQINETAVGL